MKKYLYLLLILFAISCQKLTIDEVPNDGLDPNPPPPPSTGNGGSTNPYSFCTNCNDAVAIIHDGNYGGANSSYGMFHFYIKKCKTISCKN